jgi:hypothetical protein
MATRRQNAKTAAYEYLEKFLRQVLDNMLADFMVRMMEAYEARSLLVLTGNQRGGPPVAFHSQIEYI